MSMIGDLVACSLAKGGHNMAVTRFRLLVLIAISLVTALGSGGLEMRAQTQAADAGVAPAKDESPAKKKAGSCRPAKGNLLVHMVQPVYPPLARQARIQGPVRFQVTIGTNGMIEEALVLSGHPLLITAATDAVKQWVYKPYCKN